MKGIYANPFRRLFAYWIDITILYIILFLFQFVLSSLTNNFMAIELIQKKSIFLIWLWIFISMSLPIWFYFTFSECSKRQATIGKYFLKMKVTNGDGSKLNLRKAFIRTILKLGFFEIGHIALIYPTPIFEEQNQEFRIGLGIVVILMLMYFTVTLITPKNQSIHDLIINTQVINIAEK